VILDRKGVAISDPQPARPQGVPVFEALRPNDAPFRSGWILAASDAARDVLFTFDFDGAV
jgi:hypothetical protein